MQEILKLLDESNRNWNDSMQYVEHLWTLWWMKLIVSAETKQEDIQIIKKLWEVKEQT